MAQWKFSVIPHAPRKALGLTVLEYCIADIIYRSQTNELFSIGGWAKNGCHSLGEFMGVSPPCIKGIFERFEVLELMEFKPDDKSLKRMTKKFIETAYLDEVEGDPNEGLEERRGVLRKLTEAVKKVNEGCSESEHKGNTNENELQKAGEPSIFLENENEAPQVNANPEKNDSSAPPRHIKENNIFSDDALGLDFENYQSELRRLIRKKAPQYRNEDKFLDSFCKTAFKEKWTFKEKDPGSINGMKKLLAKHKVFFDSNPATQKELKADHSEVDKIVNDFLDECMEDLHSDHSYYRDFIKKVAWNRDVRALDFEALKNLYLNNKWNEVTFVREVYKRWKPQMYEVMGIEWSKFAANRKGAMEEAMRGYNYYQSWVIPGWPKQQ